MKELLVCQKCGTEINLVDIHIGDIFLGYLCTQHSLDYTEIITKMQAKYFQLSIDEYKKFVRGEA